MKSVQSINPHDQSIIGETLITSQEEIQVAIKKAKEAFVSWKKTPIQDRVIFISNLAKLLRNHKEKLATLTTQEMGKPISQAYDDVDSEITFLNWYIENAHEALSEKFIKETASATFKIRYEPLGVCGSIAPWNFPISMASSGIIQQIIAGNTVIFKPSEYTTLTQKYFIDLLNQTGIPEGVVQGIYGSGDQGKQLVDSDIDLVWFTGSTIVGKEIYTKAGKKFIKSIMELGGSSPALVFADCDLKHTVDQLYNARFLCNGQVCSAIKRLYVQRPIFETITSQLSERVKSLKIGNPMTQVDIGPLVSKEQLDTLIKQVEDAKNKGAHIVCGGSKVSDQDLKKGNYYLPTLITDITPDMLVTTEETFGPVLPIIPFDTEEEAVSMANNSIYGLSAEVYTQDIKRAQRLSEQIDAGTVAINTDSFYYPWCPIGGMKSSGMGREYGIEGFRELTQIKHICIKKSILTQ